MPVGELGDPEWLAVLGQPVELAGKAVVVPVKGDVVDLGRLVVVGRLVGRIEWLAQTDPALYRTLRAAVTDFNVRGFGQLNAAKLRRLAEGG